VDEHLAKFLASTDTGSLITVRPNGTAHVARVTVGLVDGKVWTTANRRSVRSKHVRADPRATVFVFDSRSGRWAGLEGRITIYDGPDAPERCLALRRAVGREPEDVDAYLREAAEVGREVYELTIDRAYGAFD
jgi:PPOX class probable F420-dependent enzyme